MQRVLRSCINVGMPDEPFRLRDDVSLVTPDVKGQQDALREVVLHRDGVPPEVRREIAVLSGSSVVILIAKILTALVHLLQ